MVTRPLQPLLVMPVYRGGAKFARALASVRPAEQFFTRIVISLNGPVGSPDERVITAYRDEGPTKIEVIQTGSELPWMAHQYFWLRHLEDTSVRADDWLFWFAHDDEIRARGIAALVDNAGNWPLRAGTTYLGPWGMRYDETDRLYDGPRDAPIESWTSFPTRGPLELPVAEWIAQQLEQPTYINMSGCITQLASLQSLRSFPVEKPGGMRIEMATAAAPNNRRVAEFSEPTVITYTSKGSDRTTYSAVARRDDRHMAAWLANYVARHPSALGPMLRALASVAAHHLRARTGRGALPAEDWRFRAEVAP